MKSCSTVIKTKNLERVANDEPGVNGTAEMVFEAADKLSSNKFQWNYKRTFQTCG